MFKALALTKEDARFFIRRYTEQGTFSSDWMEKPEVETLLNSVDEVVLKGENVIVENIELSLDDFFNNIRD